MCVLVVCPTDVRPATWCGFGAGVDLGAGGTNNEGTRRSDRPKTSESRLSTKENRDKFVSSVINSSIPQQRWNGQVCARLFVIKQLEICKHD